MPQSKPRVSVVHLKRTETNHEWSITQELCISFNKDDSLISLSAVCAGEGRDEQSVHCAVEDRR